MSMLSNLKSGPFICFILRSSSISISSLLVRAMSNSMKAVVIRSTGDPSVLNVETVSVPEITSKQVLVRVHAAGFNPVDTYIREKKFGYDPRLPAILGLEAAGEVVRVGGQGGTKYKVGDRVVCALRGYGGYAEYAACDVSDLIPLSSKLSYSQGAAVYVAYFTAYKALVARCKIRRGELVMIHGASGGVGVAAMQIAKAYGARVAASAGSERGLDLVHSVADVVVDHREAGHLQKALNSVGMHDFDVILENRADLNLGIDLAALGVGGRIAVVGSRGPVQVDPRNFIRTEGSVLGVHLQKTTPEEFCEFSSALVSGMEEWLVPVVGKEYSMDEIQQAHRDLVRANGACGKMVLRVI